MTNNEAIIKTFAEAFEPELVWVRTDRVNGKQLKDAWTASRHDPRTGLGFMILVQGDGEVRCFMEGAGVGEKAAEYYGKRIALAMALSDNIIVGGSV